MSRLNLFCVLAIVAGMALSSCGGGGGSTPPPPVISVSIAPSAAQTITAGQTISFSATVSNDSGAKGVTWSLTGPGALSNQTATTATYTGAVGTAKVTATSVADATKSASTNITVTSLSVTITPSTAQTIDVAQAISFTAAVTNDINSAGVIWSLTGQGALSGQTTTAATYTGAIGAAKVTATSVADATKSASTNITITAAPAFTTTTLPAATLGAAYSQTPVSGGAGALTCLITTGTLPTGLNLNASTCAITGTPTGTTGTVNFTMKVTDSSTAGPVSISQALSILVNPAPPLTITNTSPLTPGNINAAYTTTLQSTGGLAPITWTITSGALPTGINLNAATGVVAGTPTISGVFSITFKAADSSSTQQTASKTLSLTIDDGTLAFASTNLLNPMIGEAYNQAPRFTGGTLPITWSLANGTTLPAGLSLDAATGAISGTPTATGTTAFTLQLVDSSAPTPQIISQAFTLTVTPASACGTGSDSLLTGQFAIALTGFDTSGPVDILASFTGDGAGHITAGMEDINSVGGVQLNVPITTASSSYSIGADQRGCLTLVAGGVTRFFRLAVGTITAGVSVSGRIIEFDQTGTNAVGTIDLQFPTDFSNSAVTGNYAFRARSPLTAAAGGGFFTGVGVLNLSGVGGVVTGSGDFNVNGVVDGGTAGPLTFTPGTYLIGGNGRGTLSFTSGSQTYHLIVYVLRTTELQLMSADPQTATTNLFSCFAGLQTGGPAYGNSSLNAAGVLFMSGQTAAGGGNSVVQSGVFTPDGAGAFTFSGDQNSGGTTSTQSSAGTYTVAANGRVLLTGASSPPLLMYIVNPNSTYAISTDAHVMTGDIEPQLGGPFTNASVTGAYVLADIDPVVAASGLTTGVTTYDGAGNSNGTFEVNQSGSLSLANVFTGTYAVSANGRAVSPASGTTQTLTYIINAGKLVRFDYADGNSNPALVIVQK